MTDYDLLLELIRNQGMDYKWAKMFVKKLADDEKAFTVSDSGKKWALEKGFYPGRIELYGLTEDNYQEYLPDYNYFMVHPLNNWAKIWINDKLSLKYTLNSNGCEVAMPRYFLYIDNKGNYSYLMDSPINITKNKDYIYNLLKQEKTLAIKPNSGTSGGRGFIKLEYREGIIYENNKQITIEEFNNNILPLKNYIVTEYAYQHKELAGIWPLSECTLRVIMIKKPQEKHELKEWECIVSYARFGAEISGGASNLSSGGIGIGFDFETGKLMEHGIRYKRFCTNGEWKCDKHPDTKVEWKDLTLPNWSYVRDKLREICNHISTLDYLGFDVIITDEGFKLCEINTHPAADYEQVMCGPILKKRGVYEFFKEKGLYQYDSENFWDLYLKCQK